MSKGILTKKVSPILSGSPPARARAKIKGMIDSCSRSLLSELKRRRRPNKDPGVKVCNLMRAISKMTYFPMTKVNQFAVSP